MPSGDLLSFLTSTRVLCLTHRRCSAHPSLLNLIQSNTPKRKRWKTLTPDHLSRSWCIENGEPPGPCPEPIRRGPSGERHLMPSPTLCPPGPLGCASENESPRESRWGVAPRSERLWPIPFPSSPEARLCEKRAVFGQRVILPGYSDIAGQREVAIPSALGLPAFTPTSERGNTLRRVSRWLGACPSRRRIKRFILASVVGPVSFNIFADGLSKGM